MNSTKLFFAGYNGFRQFENSDELMMSNLTGWTPKEMIEVPFDTNLIKFCSSWSVNILALHNHLYLSGFLNGHFGQSKTIKFPNNIKMISCNDKFCLIVLDTGSCSKFTFISGDLCELNFLSVDQPNKKSSIFGNVSSGDTIDDQKLNSEMIEHISCGQTLCVAVTNTNDVYNIPSRIYKFPKHVKVKKLCCGAEHALLLTANGDVYAWGSSSRGQLGLGQLESELIPVLIDGLAGIKITDIASGLWHNGAVSAFGDLYMWGWNTNGQMGRSIYKNVEIHFKSGRSDVLRHKDTSVFASPEIIDLPIGREKDGDSNVDGECGLEDQFCVESVHCGSRHTILKTKCGKILGCGFNRYGQLGICGTETDDNNIDKFTEIRHKLLSPVNIKCGSWCTIFIV